MGLGEPFHAFCKLCQYATMDETICKGCTKGFVDVYHLGRKINER